MKREEWQQELLRQFVPGISGSKKMVEPCLPSGRLKRFSYSEIEKRKNKESISRNSKKYNKIYPAIYITSGEYL